MPLVTNVPSVNFTRIEVALDARADLDVLRSPRLADDFEGDGHVLRDDGGDVDLGGGRLRGGLLRTASGGYPEEGGQASEQRQAPRYGSKGFLAVAAHRHSPLRSDLRRKQASTRARDDDRRPSRSRARVAASLTSAPP